MKQFFVFSILFLSLNSYLAFGQNLPIYLIKDRYNSNTQKLIKDSTLDFKEVKILVNYQLDPKKEDVIDYDRVEYWINKYYPAENSEGVLCIDLENGIYRSIKGNNITRLPEVETDVYNLAEKDFITLVKFIKKLRPNVKVGYFELPFRVYGKEEIRENTSEKLDPILKYVDVLFPSIYIPAPSNIDGIHSNYDFLEVNLDLAFSYSDRLEKPVIPFLWYLFYSAEDTYRNELISKSELIKYINYIEDYKSSSNEKVTGIVWWDTPTVYSKNLIKINFLEQTDYVDLTIDKVFHYYFN